MKITIFGLAGTGKSSTGKLLAEKLGFVFLSSGNLFRKMAEEHNMTLQEFEELSNNNSKFDIELDQRIKKFGEENDNFVVESRLAWHFIPDSFKVMLDCPLDVRISRIAEREKKSFDVVRGETSFRENMITTRYKVYYDIDFGNVIKEKNTFDLVIDTEKNNIEEVVSIIIRKLEDLR